MFKVLRFSIFLVFLNRGVGLLILFFAYLELVNGFLFKFCLPPYPNSSAPAFKLSGREMGERNG